MGKEMDEVSAATFGAAAAYVKASLQGMGALKGAPCEISSVTNSNGNHTINLSWEDKNGTAHNDSLIVKDGETAYQIAVRNGYEGTEKEWLATLVGGADPSDIDWSTPNAEDEEPSEISDIDW